MSWSDFEDFNGDDKSKLERLFDTHNMNESQRNAVVDYVKSYGMTALGVGLCLGLVIGLAI